MQKILLFLLIIEHLYAGFEETGNDARRAGLANARATVSGDVWSVFHNVSGLAYLERTQLGLSATPGLYNLNELMSCNIAFGIPTSAGVFGSLINKYGFSLYSEMSLGIAYACSLGNLALGSELLYQNVSIAGYGSDKTCSINIGLLGKITSYFMVGMYIHNINNPVLGRCEEPLPLIVGSGLTVAPTDNFYFYLDFEKRQNFSPEITYAIEYFIFKNFGMRFGVRTESIHYAGGLTFQSGAIQCDYAITVHHVLGVSHFFTLTFF